VLVGPHFFSAGCEQESQQQPTASASTLCDCHPNAVVH
jgi:hypothetical protein